MQKAYVRHEYPTAGKTDVHFPVQFGSFTLQASMYDIDIPGYGNGINKLHLFDADSIDESLVTDGIHFNKENIPKNLTLFLYPDDSDKAGHLLRIYQQYFMVSNAAQYIIRECEEKGYDLRKLHEHVAIQINDTHPSMVIPELIRLLGRMKFRTSYGQNALKHSIEVAQLTGLLAAEIGEDVRMAKRAGLLHDIGKALTHEMPGSHVQLGAEFCKRYDECDTVINAIYAHHGHEEPINVESASVCAADALSAARPGARREVLESFLKRVEEVENISTSKLGVLNAYAINAGREVRVIVKAELVNDDEAVLLATEIAREIEHR